MRIGIVGGTFDPIHNGHLAIAATALRHAHIDQIQFIPNRTPPHKPAPLANDHHRVAMLELALADTPAYTWSDIELRRSGPSYTIDTLRALASPTHQLVLILGSDAAALLPQWYQAQALGEYCEVTVLSRVAMPFDVHAVTAALPNLHIQVIEWPGIAVSSSDIRTRCQHGSTIDALVPPRIATYITHHQLYRSRA